MGYTQPGLLHRTRNFFFPPRVATFAELKTFITGEAAYLAQKTVFGYSRVKTVTNFDKLMTEPAFRDGIEVCRWETYASTLGDSLILLEGLLRPADQTVRIRIADRIAGLYPAWIGDHIPPHRTDWQDRTDTFAVRFALARQAEAVRPDEVVRDTARLVHETVPLHDRLKRNDREVILGDLRLHCLAMHSQMLKRFDRAALTDVLLAANAG